MASIISISEDLTSTLTDIYTVPTGKIALIEHIISSTTTAGSVTLKRYQVSDTTAYNIWSELPISANGGREIFSIRLFAGDKIQASAATTTDATIHIIGIEDDA